MTTTSQIDIRVNELTGVATGGAAIISYEFDYDKNTNQAEWEELKGFSSNDATLSFIKSGLSISTQYFVRFRAKNIFGWSGYSPATLIITRMTPKTPLAVATALVGTNVEIAWLAPDNNGASILYYDV